MWEKNFYLHFYCRIIIKFVNVNCTEFYDTAAYGDIFEWLFFVICITFTKLVWGE